MKKPLILFWIGLVFLTLRLPEPTLTLYNFFAPLPGLMFTCLAARLFSREKSLFRSAFWIGGLAFLIHLVYLCLSIFGMDYVLLSLLSALLCAVHLVLTFLALSIKAKQAGQSGLRLGFGLTGAAAALLSLFETIQPWLSLPRVATFVVLAVALLFLGGTLWLHLRAAAQLGGASVRPFSKRNLFDFAAALVCIALVFVAAFPIANQPPMKRTHQTPIPDTVDLEAAKSLLGSAGLSQEQIDSLTFQELARYDGAKVLSTVSHEQKLDAGTLRLSAYALEIAEAPSRLLVFYEWTAPPVHGYIDSLCVTASNGFAAAGSDLSSAHLYQNQSAEETGDLCRALSSLEDSVRFRTYGGDKAVDLTQRGWLALDFAQADASAVSLQVTYYHQNALFHLPYRDPAHPTTPAINAPSVYQTSHPLTLEVAAPSSQEGAIE